MSAGEVLGNVIDLQTKASRNWELGSHHKERIHSPVFSNVPELVSAQQENIMRHVRHLDVSDFLFTVLEPLLRTTRNQMSVGGSPANSSAVHTVSRHTELRACPREL